MAPSNQPNQPFLDLRLPSGAFNFGKQVPAFGGGTGNQFAGLTQKSSLLVPPGNTSGVSANTPLVKPQLPSGSLFTKGPSRFGSGGSSTSPGIGSVPSVGGLFQSFGNQIGPVPSIADQFAETGPAFIRGLPEEFFQQQRDILKRDLEESFFGPLGVFQDVTSQESAAGRLGSGVSNRIIQESASKPFADAMVDINLQTQQLQLQETARVEEFNANQFNAYQTTLAELRADDRTAELAAQELAGRLAQAEAGILSQQAIAQLESDLRIWEAALEDYRKEQELLLEEQRLAIEFIRSPIKKDTNQSQRDFGDILADRFNQGIIV